MKKPTTPKRTKNKQRFGSQERLRCGTEKQDRINELKSLGYDDFVISVILAEEGL